jgi:hypothetical protein
MKRLKPLLIHALIGTLLGVLFCFLLSGSIYLGKNIETLFIWRQSFGIVFPLIVPTAALIGLVIRLIGAD